MEIFTGTNFKYSNLINSKSDTYAEFLCKKNEITINGIDYIKNNGTHIIEFKVFIRPIQAIRLIWEEMNKQLKN